MPPKRRRPPPYLPSSVFTFPPVQPLTTTTINNPVKNENDVEITTKIYPTSYKNRKGFQVGNMKIKFDTKNAPFTSSDQVDHYLNELFSYIKWASTKKDPKDETPADMKKNIHDFLKAKKIDHVFSPKVIVGKGKNQTKKKRMKGGKSKTSKRKMKVQKGGNTDDKEIKKYISDAIEIELIDQFEEILRLHPDYADYALKEIYKTKKEPYSIDIEEMIVEAKEVL